MPTHDPCSIWPRAIQHPLDIHPLDGCHDSSWLKTTQSRHQQPLRRGNRPGMSPLMSSSSGGAVGSGMEEMGRPTHTMPTHWCPTIPLLQITEYLHISGALPFHTVPWVLLGGVWGGACGGSPFEMPRWVGRHPPGSPGGRPVQILDPNRVRKLLGVWRGGEGVHINPGARSWSGVELPLSLQPRLPHGLPCIISPQCGLVASGLLHCPKVRRIGHKRSRKQAAVVSSGTTGLQQPRGWGPD